MPLTAPSNTAAATSSRSARRRTSLYLARALMKLDLCDRAQVVVYATGLLQTGG